VDVREAIVKGWLTRGRRDSEGDYADFAGAGDDPVYIADQPRHTDPRFTWIVYTKAVSAGPSSRASTLRSTSGRSRGPRFQPENGN
jgi:hypothetical protein